MQVELNETRLTLNGTPGIFYGGEFQYFRIPAQLWESSLQKLADAHINFISCYIPWIWHEYEPGKEDFTGETVPERNLKRLFECIEALGMSVLMRPGPYVYGEYQGFGIPDWLRENHPEVLMVYENNLHSKEMALNHPVYKDYVERWMTHVFDFVSPWVQESPEAPNLIVGCQVDNETGLPQFGGVATVGDFNPDTIMQWQAHLQQQFGQIHHLNLSWKSDYTDFSVIPPPSKAHGSAIHYRVWAEFIEDYLVSHLRWLHGVFQQRFPTLYFYFNDPYLNQWPNQSPKKARLGNIGFDNYTKFSIDRVAIHDVPFSISFAPEFYRSINAPRLLMGVEMGAGWFDPRVVVTKEATLQVSMAGLLRGMRVLDYYLLHDCVESDGTPWVFQSPLDKDGELTPRYSTMQQVGKFARDYGELLAHSEPLHHSVGVLKYIPQGWEFLRHNYTLFSALDVMDAALVHFSGLPGIYGGLIETGYNPIVHDLETIDLELLCQLKVVFFASTEMMHREIYQKLLYYVEQGGTLVTFGFPPKHDTFGQLYDSNPLFPARAAGKNHHVQYGNGSLSQIALDMLDYQSLRRNHPHRLSLHTLDMMQPFVEFTKYIGRTGTWLESDRGESVWASRFTTYWQGSGVRPLLKNAQGMVGYSRRVGRGKSIFLGTSPGLFFETPAYYGIDDDKKQSVIRWLSQLLGEQGLWPLVDPIPHTEVILRQSEHGLILGLIHRGQTPQNIQCNVNYARGFNQLTICFQSDAEDFLEITRFQHLQGRLSPNAVLVAHLL